VYLLVFARGLGWQWRGIFTASHSTPPVVAAAPRSAVTGGPLAVQLAPAAGAGVQQGLKTALPPTDEPPPRNTTDRLGVSYDAQGVAVMGIDVDPSGVYNVAPGRQVRIGGPSGSLFDVLPGGKLSATTRVKEWP